MLIMNAVSVLTIYSGSYAVDSGSMQVGDVMAFIQYAMQIIMSFSMIATVSPFSALKEMSVITFSPASGYAKLT